MKYPPPISGTHQAGKLRKTEKQKLLPNRQQDIELETRHLFCGFKITDKCPFILSRTLLIINHNKKDISPKSFLRKMPLFSQYIFTQLHAKPQSGLFPDPS